MKKFLLFLFFFFLTIYFSNFSQVQAVNEEECRAHGGECREMLCYFGENDIGNFDCHYYYDVIGVQQQALCCVRVQPSQISSPARINVHGPCPTDKIYTALGCVPVGKGHSIEDFIVWFLQRLIGISGGIAFLLTIFGGFKILTSAGNPKGVQAGREIITSALIGLLFIIFSLFLLELIGVKILGIPEF